MEWAVRAVLAGIAVLASASTTADSSIVIPNGVCVQNCEDATSQQAPTPTPQQAIDPGRDFFFVSLVATGDVKLITKGGRVYKGQDAAHIRVAHGDKVVTGINARVVITLPDDTLVTLGPATELVIDSFIYDTNRSVSGVFLGIVKGSLRWITGHVAPRKIDATLRTSVVAVGIRGTDFEVESVVDGSGSIKLYSGELAISPYEGEPFTLHAGEMLRYENFTELSGPMPISR